MHTPLKCTTYTLHGASNMQGTAAIKLPTLALLPDWLSSSSAVSSCKRHTVAACTSCGRATSSFVLKCRCLWHHTSSRSCAKAGAIQ
jgi:hypothetical protein